MEDCLKGQRPTHFSKFSKVYFLVLSMMMTASQVGSLSLVLLRLLSIGLFESHHKRLLQCPYWPTHLVYCPLYESGTESTSFFWRGLWGKGCLVAEVVCFCWAANLFLALGTVHLIVLSFSSLLTCSHHVQLKFCHLCTFSVFFIWINSRKEIW